MRKCPHLLGRARSAFLIMLMSDLRTPPLDSRAARERRLTRILQILFFAAGQAGLAAWLCTKAGAPEWVHAVLLGVTILAIAATLRIAMVYLGLLLECHWSAQSTSASSAPREMCASTEQRHPGVCTILSEPEDAP